MQRGEYAAFLNEIIHECSLIYIHATIVAQVLEVLSAYWVYHFLVPFLLQYAYYTHYCKFNVYILYKQLIFMKVYFWKSGKQVV